MTSSKMTGRSAIVTGAGQGIGLAIAERLARDSVAVVLADLNLANTEAAAARLRDEGATAYAFALDAGDICACRELVSAVSAQFGPVGIVVNNAAIYPRGRVDELAMEQYEAAIRVNLLGPIALVQSALPGMIEAGWGRIVNISSMMSETAFGGDSAYTMTKTGLLGLTRSIAAENGPHGITANAICPGNIVTPMMLGLAPTVEARDGLAPGTFLKQQAERIPARRLGEPEEVAALVAFLCSADANYVNGQSIHLNGGQYYH